MKTVKLEEIVRQRDPELKQTIEHIDAAHAERAFFAAQQFHDGEADGVGTAR